jgi:hypothetical protein
LEQQLSLSSSSSIIITAHTKNTLFVTFARRLLRFMAFFSLSLPFLVPLFFYFLFNCYYRCYAAAIAAAAAARVGCRRISTFARLQPGVFARLVSELARLLYTNRAFGKYTHIKASPTKTKATSVFLVICLLGTCLRGGSDRGVCRSLEL